MRRTTRSQSHGGSRIVEGSHHATIQSVIRDGYRDGINIGPTPYFHCECSCGYRSLSSQQREYAETATQRHIARQAAA